jgi:hypothetical protein
MPECMGAGTYGNKGLEKPSGTTREHSSYAADRHFDLQGFNYYFNHCLLIDMPHSTNERCTRDKPFEGSRC